MAPTITRSFPCDTPNCRFFLHLSLRERSTAAGRRVRGYGFPGWFPKPSPGSSSRPLPQGEVKEGCPPPSCRTACVHPLRRHPGLDPGSIQPGWPSFETPEAADAWIPAFAGMTPEDVESFSSTLGSQLRPPTILSVIPAKAGIHSFIPVFTLDAMARLDGSLLPQG